MGTVGELKNIKVEHEIEWKILYFSSLSDENTKCYSSSKFSFCNESWYLRLYPNGYNKASAGYISVYLRKMSSASPIKVKYSLGLKTLKGEKYAENCLEYTFKKENEGYGFGQLLLRSELFERKADLLPGDVITVFCSLKIPVPGETPVLFTAEKILNEKCSLCEKIVDANSPPLHPKKDKIIKCPDCSAVFALQNLCDHECQAPKRDSEPITALATEKLINDLGDIFKSEEHSDVLIKVKDKEFHLHKTILSGRSPYFSAMFNAEMKEKNTGIVTIDDCDVDVFRIYALFIYTAKVDEMTVGNVCDLYEVAEKYQEDQLKRECLCFMKTKMSVESFCDFITVALKHSDSELLQNATDFFCRQTKEIIKSVTWQTFMSEYSTQANELYIKAFDSK